MESSPEAPEQPTPVMSGTNRFVYDVVMESSVGQQMSRREAEDFRALLERTDVKNVRGWFRQQITRAFDEARSLRPKDDSARKEQANG